MNAVENPMVLGRIERPSYGPVVFKVVNEPRYDFFGSFIASNDEYLLINGDVVHVENAVQYLVEVQGAKLFTKK